uniref:Carboxylic ester hydrolase n=1 Tax=Holotrichia parallela TaxID=93412 RepID=A0A2P1ERM8_HOLPA|nr:odorant degrading protein 5 [Holotrichia parallela]
MKVKLVIILLFIATINGKDDLNAPQVEIPNGLLQGVHEQSYNGRTFSAFEGIPYARPPVGELRFEAPKESYNWTGTWIANTKHRCLQTLGPAISGDEDCLYLNVYVPRENPSPSDNLNVIVHIHGGGFAMWDAHFYSGPKYLMDEDVIFVTMNYRLGPFGFLSTEDKVAPGNNGLKDQALSLKWIQKNIKFFGGNPDSVTITGMSAGSASVHLHYFSPLSKGTFHAGVSQSGTVMDPWVIRHSPLKSTVRLAENAGCPTETSRELVDCLKSRSGTKIAEILKSQESQESPVSFGPVVEPEHDGAFLTQHPYKMLLDKTVADVPWVVSVTEREGLFMLLFAEAMSVTAEQDIEKFLPQLLHFSDADDGLQESEIHKIKEHYFNKATTDFTETFIDITSDRFFLAGADAAAKLQARANKSPVYFYKFGYRGQHSLVELVLPNAKHTVATHGDDCQYYLHSAAAEDKLSESDEKMKSVFSQWLLNYAETRKPSIKGVEWNPVSGGDILEFLYIENPDSLFMDEVEGLGDSSFWNNLSLKDNEVRQRIRDEL